MAVYHKMKMEESDYEIWDGTLFCNFAVLTYPIYTILIVGLTLTIDNGPYSSVLFV